MLVEILDFYMTPARKTRIMYNVNVSYPQLLKPIERLQKFDLLRHNIDKKTYQTTEKGDEFLKRYSALPALLKP
jgi:predicted transcriptional regulator